MNVSLHYQRYTLLLVAARKIALEDVTAVSFFLQSNYTVDKLTTDRNKKKKKKLNNTKTFPYCFDSSNKAYKHIHKITIV